MRRFVWTLQWLSFVSALLLTRQGSSAECECGKLEATSTPNKTFSGPPYGENAPIFGGIWPLPQKLVYDTTNRTLKYKGISIKFALNGDAECDILQFARETYLNKWLFPIADADDVYYFEEDHSPLSLIIRTKDGRCPALDDYPQQDMNEKYMLSVPPTGVANLYADEVWGILRGLETFSQLIFWSDGTYYIRAATIHDWPEYSVRGVMLDTSRHYLSKNIILRQIDLMAQNKMNALHWHIVDMESFPYVSTAFPNLSRTGAYSKRHTYSPEIVEEIVQYARLRGIRVIPEFDTPGQPGLLAECVDDERVASSASSSGIIDPTEESNYEFLESFFEEVVNVFPEKYTHLGGDESQFWMSSCWFNNTKILAFMKENNISDFVQLEDYYFSRLMKIMRKLKDNDPTKRVIFWNEVFANNKPDKESIIHIWTPYNHALPEYLKNVTSAGYNAIVSSCWYLSNIVYGSDWFMGNDDAHSYYYCDPRGFNGTEEEKARVLGGVAAMWGEYVDGTNLESRLWPRASAVAERLWSSSVDTKNATMAWPRLHEHRCRMISRGYRAQPAYGPDSCPIPFNEGF